jgi:alkanesulfonate monooxygenase SsuD/methylene tetrahydromethanopterin reductase-like flavin-dependent oxidoreductase (luciferase family)
MRFGIYAPNFGDFSDPHNLLKLARAAETAGWDGFFLWDHLLLNRTVSIPMTDAWVVLAAIAASTKRILLGPMITPVARRRPWKLAREAAALDHLSNGRLILGVGLGSPAEPEFQCFGEDPDDHVRAEKLDEGLSIVDGLWSGEPVVHRGKHYTVDGVSFLPRPVQRPRIPIWVAGMLPNRAPLRRAARWDGVFALKNPPSGLSAASFSRSTFWLTPAELAGVASYVVAHRASGAGALEVVASGATPGGDHARAKEIASSYQDAGATWWLEWLDDQRGSFSEMLERVESGPPG